MKLWTVLPFIFSALCGAAQSGERQFFVSPDCKANNPGTKEKPFATAKQARDALRKMKSIEIPEHFIPSFKPAKVFVEQVKANVDSLPEDDGDDD